MQAFGQFLGFNGSDASHSEQGDVEVEVKQNLAEDSRGLPQN